VRQGAADVAHEFITRVAERKGVSAEAALDHSEAVFTTPRGAAR
jgi:hypothetical protein